MTHSEMDELYELYLLGVLEFAEAAEIREHLNRNCEYCLAHIQESSAVVASFALMAEVVAPPPELRERILSLASPARKKTSPFWASAFAIACAATIAVTVWGVSERGTIEDTLKRLQDVSRQRNELRSALAILSESDTRTVAFGSEQAGPHGRVFLSRNGGVVFVGGKLPELASGKTFQLWLVPAKGNPQSAGLFTPNAEGISVNVLAQSINPSDYAAVAVSVEPDGGSPQPTTKPIIVVPLA